ncbi:MAG: transglutaminase family protein, partial [Verrucomicrobiota bacterium]
MKCPMATSSIGAARWALLAVLAGALVSPLEAAESRKKSGKSAPPKEAAEQTVEEISASVKESLVVIHYVGRSGAVEGVGTGFVVGANGLVATSLHVIGEGRPIQVQLSNGRQYQATKVHAWDRKLDLAVVQIDAKNLKPLPLGDSEALRQGAQVVAIGNPLGLRYSVVQGVVSAKRDIDGIDMIQLAIPVEPGNSGGPLFDMQGRVHGILTMKSATTANIGFAMPVNSLKPLLEKPNPVPIERWLTIGTVNPEEWRAVFGGRWTQKGGMIQVDGAGQGFGGRALCLAQKLSPKAPYEIAVSVKLDDERGAAGLAFASDGQDRHYGFYPSAGRLRLTRFEGANVYTWQVMREIDTPHYRPGEWNHLKVRFEPERIRCFVNDQLVADVEDEALPGTMVGLAKFRETKAEFKDFRVGAQLPNYFPAPEVAAKILKQAEVPHVDGEPLGEVADALQGNGRANQIVLLERAKQLERQASRLRVLSAKVHYRQVQDELVKLFAPEEEKVDLFRAALLVSKLDNPDLDVDAYLRELERHAREIASRLPKRADDEARLGVLSKYLFEENGFHGNRSDYYNRANSYVNDVLDDREGIPITLSVVYLELARRIGLERVHGLGLPGHFVVQYKPARGEARMIDVFEGGGLLGRKDAEELVRSYSGRDFVEAELRPATK